MLTKDEQQRRAAEYWFRRRGLPSIVRGRPRDLVVRSLPAIVWLAFSELLYWLLTAIDGDAEFDARLNTDAFAVGYTAALIGLVVIPVTSAWLASRWTRRLVVAGNGFTGAILIVTGFILAWPLLGRVIGGSAEVVPIVAFNVGSVVVFLTLTILGVGSIFCWALRAALRQLHGIGTMTSRTLPLLLLVTTFGFFTAEIWQALGTMPRWRMWLVIGFFAGVGVLFLVSVLSAELRALTTTTGTAATEDERPEHPFGSLDPDAEPPPLTRAERANMIFVLLLTQVLQALVFGTLVFVLYVILGRLTATPASIKAWSGQEPTAGTLFGIQIPAANEVLQVSLFIAAFSALYFAANIVTSSDQRAAFVDPVLRHLNTSLAARAVYVTRLSSSPEVDKTSRTTGNGPPDG